MGEMLLNGRLYGASGIRELTQAQYDALPSSKLTDGVLYCIKDTGIVEGEKFAPIIYSLEERCVGVWVDGRPLYAKSYAPRHLNGGQMIEVEVFNQAEKYFVHSDFVWSPGWNLGTSPASTNWHYWSLQGLGQSGWNENVSVVSAQVYVQENKLYFRDMGNAQSAGCTITGTIYYVKIADIPGSGKWAQDGIPAVHYSTDEKVIGTWIDGKPLYEKTIDCGALPNATSKSIAHGISNLDFIVSMNGMAQRSTGLNRIPLPFVNVDSMTTQIRVMVSDTDIAIQCGTDRSDFTKSYITIQYTKTSS